MQFIELTTYTTTEAAELVSDLMWNYTNYGVAISDPADIRDLKKQVNPKWDYIDDSLLNTTEEVLVKCYISKDIASGLISLYLADLEFLAERLAGNLNAGSLETVQKEVDGDAWREIWKSHYKPLPMGKIVVCPEWISYEAKKGEEVVTIDSNMAFGTGEHETTSMCIDLLQTRVKAGDTVVDIGTGSGILGISMLKLGAEMAYMTDIDYIAVQSATRNAQNNGVKERCFIGGNEVLSAEGAHGDIVTANITAGVLIMLSDSIKNAVKPNGTLILSGIINSRKEEVLSHFTALGFVLEDSRNKGEWNALCFRRAV
jgi:ribosomal protein L11 methyltransferase